MNRNGSYIKCDTKRPSQTSSSKANGPAPDGLYSIGAVYTHRTHGISWANLYPIKQNGNGWWDYYRTNPATGRGYIGLHPGQISQGCITVTDQSCWNKLERMLRSKNGDQITVSRTWWRTGSVKRIGLILVKN